LPKYLLFIKKKQRNNYDTAIEESLRSNNGRYVNKELYINNHIFFSHFNSCTFINRKKLDILIEFHFFQVFLLELVKINIYKPTG